MKWRTVRWGVYFLIATLVGLYAGVYLGQRMSLKRQHAIEARTAAWYTYMYLARLRGPDPEDAVVGMETWLDLLLKDMWENRRELSRKEQQEIMRFLHDVKQYRAGVEPSPSVSPREREARKYVDRLLSELSIPPLESN